ncbi:endonuclease/exonuclease/phosphatase family protein [Gelidibacter sediminis]|nr:endonuclease/exonuclease/phosphatase family protein [Gelidibacter sediminis]
MKTSKLIIKACAVIAYAFLLMMHFIVKDHFQFLQIFFYAFPLPILIFLGCVITLLFYKTRTYFIAGLVIILGLTAYWFSSSYNFVRHTDIPEDATTVLFWNAADGYELPVNVIVERISIIKPDVIGLVETQYASENDLELLSTTFPSYEFRILGGFMMVGVKGSITKVNYLMENASYHVNFIEAQLPSGAISFAVTDIFQSPTMDKKKAIGTVLKLASQRNTDIIVGDFNAPRESVHFKAFEKNYTSFSNYGQGFTATWPFEIPLLELDQIFARKPMTPILLQKFNYPESDHAMLIGYYKE